MNTIKINKGTTQMVAHRGLSKIETENTNAAFIAAGNRSYFGIETDIYRTADGRFVISHDSTLHRVADCEIKLEQAVTAELNEIILKDKNGNKCRGDLRVSFLEEYVGICKKYEKICVLELKSSFTDEEIDRMIELIKEQEYLEGVIFISFDFENLVKVRKALPEQTIQFLTTDNSDEMIAKLVEYKMDIDIVHSALTEERVEAMHRAGLKVNCWTVDNPEDGECLASWGVDFITSNILE